MGFMVYEVQGRLIVGLKGLVSLWLRVYGFWSRVQGQLFYGLGFTAYGLGFWVYGLGQVLSTVQGLISL